MNAQPNLTTLDADKAIQVVTDRMEAMLKDPDIKALYRSIRNKELADKWLAQSAIASLIVPVDERK